MLTTRSKPNDTIGTNDIVCPASLFLKLEQEILLRIVEVETLIIVTWMTFVTWLLYRSKVNTIVLESQQYSSYNSRVRVDLPSLQSEGKLPGDYPSQQDRWM